jgi:hypothetical protein
VRVRDGRGEGRCIDAVEGDLAVCLSAQNKRSLAGLEVSRPCSRFFKSKKTITSIALNSFVTTVATPRKKVGRLCPSIWCPYPLTSTKVPLCSPMFCEMPEGYIWSTVGTKTPESVRVTSEPDLGSITETESSSSKARSPRRVRG